MGRELQQASIHVTKCQSLVIPLVVEGLPDAIDALGRRWLRKLEFHLTAVAVRVIDPIGAREDDLWKRITVAASGRRLGPVEAQSEIRRVTHPDRPDFQTLIVMAECPGLDQLYVEISRVLERTLTPPPTHVTLYSTNPAEGIGIVDERELAERAPPLSDAEQTEVRRAISFP
jgi:hypothetical protein